MGVVWKGVERRGAGGLKVMEGGCPGAGCRREGGKCFMNEWFDKMCDSVALFVCVD